MLDKAAQVNAIHFYFLVIEGCVCSAAALLFMLVTTTQASKAQARVKVKLVRFISFDAWVKGHFGWHGSRELLGGMGQGNLWVAWGKGTLGRPPS